MKPIEQWISEAQLSGRDGVLDHIDNVPVRLAVEPLHTNPPATRFVVSADSDDGGALDLEVRRQLPPIVRLFDVQNVEVGEPSFDNMFRVRTATNSGHGNGSPSRSAASPANHRTTAAR